MAPNPKTLFSTTVDSDVSTAVISNLVPSGVINESPATNVLELFVLARISVYLRVSNLYFLVVVVCVFPPTVTVVFSSKILRTEKLPLYLII